MIKVSFAVDNKVRNRFYNTFISEFAGSRIFVKAFLPDNSFEDRYASCSTHKFKEGTNLFGPVVKVGLMNQATSPADFTTETSEIR